MARANPARIASAALCPLQIIVQSPVHANPASKDLLRKKPTDDKPRRLAAAQFPNGRASLAQKYFNPHNVLRRLRDAAHR